MEKILKIILLTVTLIGFTSSSLLKDPLNPHGNKDELKFLEENDELWFEQKLDHFNQQDNSTFKQRYWIIDEFFVKENKFTPLFLYVCGEWTCSKPSTNDFVVQLAKSYNAILVIHEHRYYGKSQPKEDWSTENLRWLNTDQALADLAHFTRSLNKQFSITYNIPEERRWVLIGGSYPGALVSWFRGKFPHIALGSWSSSGVVNAIEDFHQFDETVSYAFSKTENCREKVLELVNYVNKEFEENRGNEIKKQWESENIPDDEFFWYYSDIIAESVQYGGRSSLCSTLFKLGNDYSQMNQFLYDTKGKADKIMYPSEYLRDTKIVYSKNARQWTYQYCSQLGYLQTPSKTFPPLKNKSLTLDFWYSYCKRIFSIDITPRTELWNERYGGNTPSITNVIYMNGDEDPWKTSSVLKSNDLLIHTFELKCDNCAHCVDLHYTSDPVVLSAQNKAKEILSEWLKLESLGESLGLKSALLEKFVVNSLLAKKGSQE